MNTLESLKEGIDMFYVHFHHATPSIKNLSFISLYSAMCCIVSLYNSGLWFDYVNIIYKDNYRNVAFNFTLTKEMLDLTQDHKELLIRINKIFVENIDNYIKNKENFKND